MPYGDEMITKIDLRNCMELNQLTLLLFYKLKEKDMGVSPYGVQKTLFKLKMELGEEHSLYDSIHIIGIIMVRFF